MITLNFQEVLDRVYNAKKGVEVRYGLGQGFEYCKQYADTATTKAGEAEASAKRAENAVSNIDQQKNDAVKAVQQAQTTATNAVTETKNTALKEVANATADAKNAASASARSASAASDSASTASGAATTATTKSGEAATSATEAFTSQKKAAENQQAAEDAANRAAAIVSTDKTLSVDGAPADAKATGEALADKADAVAPHTFTIPTTGWEDDDTVSDFPHKLDISIEELTAQDIVNVVVAPDDTTPAADACFTNTETLQGILRLRAKNVPTAEINATWYIVR